MCFYVLAWCLSFDENTRWRTEVALLRVGSLSLLLSNLLLALSRLRFLLLFQRPGFDFSTDLIALLSKGGGGRSGGGGAEFSRSAWTNRRIWPVFCSPSSDPTSPLSPFRHLSRSSYTLASFLFTCHSSGIFVFLSACVSSCLFTYLSEYCCFFSVYLSVWSI